MKTQTSVAVVYHSVTGTTAGLAEAAVQGAGSIAGVRAFSVRIEGGDIHEGRYGNTSALKALGEADAIIFGSPTFMGSVSAQFKAFADATSEFWFQRHWAGKLAPGLPSATTPAGTSSIPSSTSTHWPASTVGCGWVSTCPAVTTRKGAIAWVPRAG